MTLKKILFAEDDNRDAELTIEAFSELNLANNVIRVKNGSEVLDYLNKKGIYKNREDGFPVVIILDLNMPILNGLETLKIIKNTPEFKNIPVVMLTSSKDEINLAKSYNMGVNAYVVKPIDFVDFMNAIKQLGMFWAILNNSPLNN